MANRGNTQLNCFSPPVMLATLIIEFSLAIYTIWRYKLTILTRLVVAMLVALATFQLAEYHVCTGYGSHAEAWSRLGFVAITTLPALGTHLLHVLADKPRRRLVMSAYLTMFGYIVLFLTYHTAFIGHKCTGNYVIFQMGPNVGGSYYVYYYGWLAIGIGLGVSWVKELLLKGRSAKNRLEAVQGLLAGYLVFLIPTTVVNTLKPSTISGLPSVMCGFAVLFALILGFYILPRAAEPKT